MKPGGVQNQGKEPTKPPKSSSTSTQPPHTAQETRANQADSLSTVGNQTTDTVQNRDQGNPDIHINEVLSFICNKVNIMPYEMIVKLCMDFYSNEDVESAKDILFNTAFSDTDEDKPRNIKRRGAGKRQSDLQDILNIFLELTPHSIPCYVAKDLSNLPPLSMNNFDMASVIRDIENLKTQMAILQEAQEANLTANVALSREALVTHSSQSPARVPNQVSLTEVGDDSGSDGTGDLVEDLASNSANCTDGDFEAAESQDGRSDSGVNEDVGGDDTTAVKAVATTTAQQNDEVTVSGESDVNDLLRLAEVQNLPKHRSGHQRPTYSKALRQQARPNPRPTTRPESRPARAAGTRPSPGSSYITGRGRHFTLHSSSRSNPRSMPDHRQQKQRISVGLFISRLASNTLPRHVIQHVLKETGLKVKCDPIKTKHSGYTSFCVRVPCSLQQRLLDPMVWPEGTLVREYYDNQ